MAIRVLSGLRYTSTPQCHKWPDSKFHPTERAERYLLCTKAPFLTSPTTPPPQPPTTVSITPSISRPNPQTHVLIGGSLHLGQGDVTKHPPVRVPRTKETLLEVLSHGRGFPGNLTVLSNLYYPYISLHSSSTTVPFMMVRSTSRSQISFRTCPPPMTISFRYVPR